MSGNLWWSASKAIKPILRKNPDTLSAARREAVQLFRLMAKEVPRVSNLYDHHPVYLHWSLLLVHAAGAAALLLPSTVSLSDSSPDDDVSFSRPLSCTAALRVLPHSTLLCVLLRQAGPPSVASAPRLKAASDM